MSYLAKVQANYYEASDYEHVLSLLLEMDALIDRIRKEDKVYGDTWQNFADATKTKITKELIKMVKKDLKSASKKQ